MATAWLERTRHWMYSLAVASLVANIVIVVTGGAVRLTGSGLGCPTWPRCTDQSFVPHGALGMHGAIEFGNRLVTFVLAAIAIATCVAAWRLRPRNPSVRRLAAVLLLGIPGQAIIGGITVLTDLNPWIVGLHMMLSMVLISIAVLLIYQLRKPVRALGPPLVRRLAGLLVVVAYGVLYLGTVVTGSGPHAGDAAAPRNGLDPELLSHVHAAFVYVLVALTLAVAVLLRRVPEGHGARRAVHVLLALEVLQGLLGFVQYRLDLPALLVGLHLSLAAVLAAAVTWLAVEVRGSCPAELGAD